MTAVDPSADPFSANEAAWAQAARWGGEPRMNELEMLMWRSERHPQRHHPAAVHGPEPDQGA